MPVAAALPRRRGKIVVVVLVGLSSSEGGAYWTSIHEDIGAHLRQAVVVKERVEVYEPMRHFVFAAPVNMAPVLLVHSCKPNTKLLMADAMLPFGLELLASSDNPAGNNSGRILRVMVEMTRAMGSQDVEMTYETYKKNEGGLHTCGAACGAILGGGSVEEIELSLNLQLLAMCDRVPVARSFVRQAPCRQIHPRLQFPETLSQVQKIIYTTQ
ncbi:Heterodimeric geranylgeranyl pyrophosphate synthase small subunit [Citrus sinensis]|nr:Heterodimeric geranylgeranyl pyrophosphate synthase small subunit [Citrus sinensis]